MNLCAPMGGKGERVGRNAELKLRKDLNPFGSSVGETSAPCSRRGWHKGAVLETPTELDTTDRWYEIENMPKFS